MDNFNWNFARPRIPPHVQNYPRDVGLGNLYMGPTWRGTYHNRTEIWDTKRGLQSFPGTYEARKAAYLLDRQIKHPCYPWTEEHFTFARERVTNILGQFDTQNGFNYADNYWKVGPKPQDLNSRPVSPIDFNKSVPSTPDPEQFLSQLVPPDFTLEENRLIGRRWDFRDQCWVPIEDRDNSNNPVGVPVDSPSGPGSPGSPNSPGGDASNPGNPGNPGDPGNPGKGDISFALSYLYPYTSISDIYSVCIDNGLSIWLSLGFVSYSLYKEYRFIFNTY